MPRSLTVEQFQKLSAELHEPHRTIALVCICFGLRISEALALRWLDVDWLNGMLRVERGIVDRNVDDTKTDESRKSLAIAEELLDRLKVWKQATGFAADSDWIFASPGLNVWFHLSGALHGSAESRIWLLMFSVVPACLILLVVFAGIGARSVVLWGIKKARG